MKIKRKEESFGATTPLAFANGEFSIGDSRFRNTVTGALEPTEVRVLHAKKEDDNSLDTFWVARLTFPSGEKRDVLMQSNNIVPLMYKEKSRISNSHIQPYYSFQEVEIDKNKERFWFRINEHVVFNLHKSELSCLPLFNWDYIGPEKEGSNGLYVLNFYKELFDSEPDFHTFVLNKERVIFNPDGLHVCHYVRFRNIRVEYNDEEGIYRGQVYVHDDPHPFYIKKDHMYLLPREYEEH